MSKLILVLSLIPVIVGVGMALQDGMTASPQAPETVDAASNLLLLDNGAIVEARDGSVAKRLVDWLQDPDRSARVFHLGGVQFEGRARIPTDAARRRVPTLTKLLIAYPDVRATFVGSTNPTQNRVDDQAVAFARANWDVEALQKAGINPRRLSARAATEGEQRLGQRFSPQRVDLELSTQ